MARLPQKWSVHTIGYLIGCITLIPIPAIDHMYWTFIELVVVYNYHSFISTGPLIYISWMDIGDPTAPQATHVSASIAPETLENTWYVKFLKTNELFFAFLLFLLKISSPDGDSKSLWSSLLPGFKFQHLKRQHCECTLFLLDISRFLRKWTKVNKY